MAKELKLANILSAPRYIQKPAFMLKLFRERNTFGRSGFPFTGPHRAGLPPVTYDPADYPGTADALSHVAVLPINEFYEDKHIEFIALRIREAAQGLQRIGA